MDADLPILPSILSRYRFLEFRYSRSEGQSWPSVEDLFAKGERWGSCMEVSEADVHSKSTDLPTSKRSSIAKSTEKSDFSSATSKTNKTSGDKQETICDSSKPKCEDNTSSKPDSKTANKSKNNVATDKPILDDSDSLASHRVVVYFMPDIWSIMPSTHQWEKIKTKYQDPSSYASPKEETSSKESVPIPKTTDLTETDSTKIPDVFFSKTEPDCREATSLVMTTTSESSAQSDATETASQKVETSQEQPSAVEVHLLLYVFHILSPPCYMRLGVS